jgi:hypothetical protein
MKHEKFQIVVFVILLILFIVCGKAKAQTECDCNITQTNLIELDSVFRAEQLRYMQINKAYAQGIDVESEKRCSKLKLDAVLKAIKKRKEMINKLKRC